MWRATRRSWLKSQSEVGLLATKSDCSPWERALFVGLEYSGIGGSVSMQQWRYSSFGHASAMSNKPDNEMAEPGSSIGKRSCLRFFGPDDFTDKRKSLTESIFHCLNSKISSFGWQNSGSYTSFGRTGSVGNGWGDPSKLLNLTVLRIADQRDDTIWRIDVCFWSSRSFSAFLRSSYWAWY